MKIKPDIILPDTSNVPCTYLAAKTNNDIITNLQINFPKSQEEVRFVMTKEKSN